VTLTDSECAPEARPVVLSPSDLIEYCVTPCPLNVTDFKLCDPSCTCTFRIPELDVKVIVGTTYVLPTSTHLGLTGLLVIFGVVHAGVYLVPQRFLVDPWARTAEAEATPAAPATNAHATTTVEMALRNLHYLPAVGPQTLNTCEKPDRRHSTIMRPGSASIAVARMRR
jgi:hypothetical protein